MSADSHRKTRSHWWRRLRVYFRRFRITVLLLLFALVCVGGYLNHIGLPAFIKRPLLENLRSRGVDLEFSRLRLRWYRGIVAEDVRVLLANSPSAPEFAARSADVQLNYAALRRLKLEVTGVTLRDGSLAWQFEPTNAPVQVAAPQSQAFVITNLTGRLRFLPGDEWSLDQLQAQYLGAQFYFSARITNASVLGRLPVFQSPATRPKGDFLARLRRIQDRLLKVHFTQPPVFRLSITGDGLDQNSFAGTLHVAAPDATTPWGELQQAQLVARLSAADSNAPLATEVSLKAESAHTQWASVRQLDLTLKVVQNETNELHCVMTLHAGQARSDWGSATNAALTAVWGQGLDAVKPREGELLLLLTGAESRWARADALAVNARFRPPRNPLPPDPALGFWSKALPYALDFECAATNASNDKIRLDSVAAAAHWDAPQFTLTRLRLLRPDGNLVANAGLDVVTRQLTFDGQACFDLRLLDPVLTEKSREWIDKFTWQGPPALALSGQLTLPDWTNRQPDWRKVQEGIVLNGHVSLTNGSYRGISALAATTHLGYSNRVWRLPDLAVTRPEGTLHVGLQSDEVSHDYLIRLRGPLDPRILASQLDEKAQRGLGYFEFTDVPWIEGDVSGRWYEHERTRATARIAWTNFSFRAQHADRLAASLDYSNQVLTVLNPQVDRGRERATADGIKFDFAANLAWLTNGYTDTDPMAIATAIGPKVAAAVANYQFLKPPVVRVNGVIPLRGERDANLHFDLEGGPFRWMKFDLPHIAGHVCWADESVTLSNITASFYGGEARGSARFDVHERGSTPFRFDLAVTNTDLHTLISDLHSPTNHLEGILAGQLVVTAANTTNWQTWNGHGKAELRDGLIWDTPVFGIMSSLMNAFVPGIGNSRASEAGGTFTITNSVIHTRNLDIRASGMRLQYEGTVDFRTRVDARVQAELLRDTWIVGRLVSTALWPVSKLFEYKVTGTLAEPKPEPVFLIPKLLFAPLHPMKALKGVFEYTPGDTNAPAELPPGAPVKRGPPPGG